MNCFKSLDYVRDNIFDNENSGRRQGGFGGVPAIVLVITDKIETRSGWTKPIFDQLTDTGEDSKLVHRRKRPKVDTLFSSLFSDASERRV